MRIAIRELKTQEVLWTSSEKPISKDTIRKAFNHQNSLTPWVYELIEITKDNVIKIIS